MDDYTKQIIYTEGGNWSEIEVLGNRAIVKVKAEEATIVVLDSVFKRIPKDGLDDPLSDLSLAVKTALKNEALDMGYTLQEIQAKLPNDLNSYTLRDVLKMLASRRRKPRYDADTDTIILDGIDQPVGDLDSVDRSIV